LSDKVRIGNADTNYEAKVNSDGSLLVGVGSAAVSATNPVPVVEAWSWSITGDSAANTAQTLTKAAVAGKTHYIFGLEVVIKGAAAGADIDIELKDDTTAIYKTCIGMPLLSGLTLDFI